MISLSYFLCHLSFSRVILSCVHAYIDDLRADFVYYYFLIKMLFSHQKPKKKKKRNHLRKQRTRSCPSQPHSFARRNRILNRISFRSKTANNDYTGVIRQLIFYKIPSNRLYSIEVLHKRTLRVYTRHYYTYVRVYSSCYTHAHILEKCF